MCVITTSLAAAGLGVISASAAGSALAVGTTTVLANAAIGAGISAGIGAATGQRGSDLWRSAAIGAAGAGVASGLGIAVNGVTTAAGTASAATGSGASGGTSAAGGTTGGLSGSDITSLVVQGAAGAADAYSSHEQGKAEAEAYKQQSHLNRIRAGQVMESAEIEKMDLARRQKATIGKGKVAAASSGIMLESRAEASPSVWEEDARAELEYEGSKIMHNANMQAWGYQENANIDMLNARNARRTGNLKAATSLIKTGAGMYVSAYGKPGKSLFA